jgi:hypothetical protein
MDPAVVRLVVAAPQTAARTSLAQEGGAGGVIDRDAEGDAAGGWDGESSREVAVGIDGAGADIGGDGLREAVVGGEHIDKISGAVEGVAGFGGGWN